MTIDLKKVELNDVSALFKKGKLIKTKNIKKDSELLLSPEYKVETELVSESRLSRDGYILLKSIDVNDYIASQKHLDYMLDKYLYHIITVANEEGTKFKLFNCYSKKEVMRYIEEDKNAEDGYKINVGLLEEDNKDCEVNGFEITYESLKEIVTKDISLVIYLYQKGYTNEVPYTVGLLYSALCYEGRGYGNRKSKTDLSEAIWTVRDSVDGIGYTLNKKELSKIVKLIGK